MAFFGDNPFNFASSMAATLLRGGVGINSDVAAVKPEALLKLYDIEACPYCRLVREVLTELDLDFVVYPCPKNGDRFRPKVEATGGKAQFPYLQDDNTGVSMYESTDIIAYLFETYGQRSVPLKWQFNQVHLSGSKLASAACLGLGVNKRSAQQPEALLELYSFESSPFARLVRERLCEMQIPYIVRSCGRSTLSEWVLPPVRDALGIVPHSELQNRQVLQEKTGRMAIPYLVDPNTETELYESDAIVAYLQQTYGASVAE